MGYFATQSSKLRMWSFRSTRSFSVIAALTSGELITDLKREVEGGIYQYSFVSVTNVSLRKNSQAKSTDKSMDICKWCLSGGYIGTFVNSLFLFSQSHGN